MTKSLAAVAVLLASLFSWTAASAQEAKDGAVPEDVALVVQAVESALRHRPTAVEGVIFAEGVADLLREKAFDYAGFEMVDTEIVEALDDPDGGGRKLSGSMLFVDPAGRRARAAFSVAYRNAGFAYMIVAADATVETMSEPRVAFYLVKSALLPEDLITVAPDYAALMGWLAEKAWRPSDGALPAGDYTVVAAFLDRMPGQVASVLSLYDGATERKDGRMSIYGYDGWRVVLLRASFGVGKGSPLKARVSIQPTLDGKPTGTPRDVGTLDFATLTPNF